MSNQYSFTVGSAILAAIRQKGYSRVALSGKMESKSLAEVKEDDADQRNAYCCQGNSAETCSTMNSDDLF